MKLEVSQLFKSFEQKEVLHGISFSIESGKALGLLGRNGAGKTTTIRILMDVFRANSGEILLDGKTFQPKNYKIGYLPEERGLYPKKKVGEQLAYLGCLRGLTQKEAKANTSKWLQRLGVLEYEKRNLDTLSKGNQQKVQLAQTLVCNPDIVILDEPFSGLDPVNSQILKDVVKEQIEAGKLIIFSSHQMNYVEEFCEDIVIINHGDIVLKGELMAIKREYGNNRLTLSCDTLTSQNLTAYLEKNESDFLQVTGTQKNQVIISLKEGIRKQEVLLRLLNQNISLQSFGNYEPSLNDIFVERAGD